jgi:hypothetical protein
MRQQIRLSKPLALMGHHFPTKKEEEEVKNAQNKLVMNMNSLNCHEHSLMNSGVQYFKNIQTFESDNKIKNQLIMNLKRGF